MSYSLTCEHPNFMVWDDLMEQWIFAGSSPPSDVMCDRSFSDRVLVVPCGTCLHCRLRKANDWKTRITAESTLYDTCFHVTLTYDDEHLHWLTVPEYRVDKNTGETQVINHQRMNLVYNDVQLFKKELFEDLRRRGFVGTRFFCAGEYGDSNMRPHYHIIFMNLPLDDLKFWNKSKSGALLYRSSLIEKHWKKGFSAVEYANAAAIGYVARYTLKKALSLDKDLGGIKPEFIRMSNRPGIGRPYYDLHKDEILKDDCLYLHGKRLPLPRYFDDLGCRVLNGDMVKSCINLCARRERSDRNFVEFMRTLTVPYQQWHDDQVELLDHRCRERLIRPL